MNSLSDQQQDLGHRRRWTRDACGAAKRRLLAARHVEGNVIGKMSRRRSLKRQPEAVVFEPFSTLARTFNVVRHVPDGIDEVCLRLGGWGISNPLTQE